MQIGEFLTALGGSEKLVITTSDNRITINLPTVADSIAFWRGRQDVLKKAAASAHRDLVEAGMQLDVRVRGKLIAQLGAGTQPGWLSHALDFAPVEIKPYEVLRLILGLEGNR